MIPKSLVPVAGSPIIFRQLELLARYGVTEVAILSGHLAEQLEVALPPQAKRLNLRVEFFWRHKKGVLRDRFDRDVRCQRQHHSLPRAQVGERLGTPVD